MPAIHPSLASVQLQLLSRARCLRVSLRASKTGHTSLYVFFLILMILIGRCPRLYLFLTWHFAERNLPFGVIWFNVECYLPSPWIPSLRFLHFSGFVLLPISQSGWELWADTSAFCWFPPVSAPSDLQFFLVLVVFTVTHQLKGTWLNPSLPSLSLSPPFCLSPRSLLPPVATEWRKSGNQFNVIMTNESRRLARIFFFCVCVCVWDGAAGKSQMNQSAVIASANTAGGRGGRIDGWMDGGA